MDINGAKALKERLGRNGTDHAPAAPVDVDVSDDAPPVYQWLGVAHDRSRAADDEQPATASPSLFKRLGLSFR
jgi:hypothetical protein